MAKEEGGKKEKKIIGGEKYTHCTIRLAVVSINNVYGYINRSRQPE